MCQGNNDVRSHEFVAFDDRRAIMQRREFLKYRFQQLRGYGCANGQTSLEQFVDRVVAGNYQQSAKVQSSQPEGRVGDGSTALMANPSAPRPPLQRAVEPHEGTAKFRLKD